MWVRKLTSTILAVIIASILVIAQGTGTPATLQIRLDANGYLVVSGVAQTSPVSQPIVFNNARLRTDANGYLLVAISGGAISGDTTQTGNFTLTGNEYISGSLGIGTTDPIRILTVSDGTGKPTSSISPGGVLAALTGTTSSGTLAGINANNTVAHMPGLYLRSIRARGTLTAPATVVDDDLSGFFESEVFTTGRCPIANIGMFATGVSGANANGYTSFLIGTNCSTSEKFRIDASKLRALIPIRSEGYVDTNRAAYGHITTATSALTLSGATTTASNLIPAGAFVIGVATTTTTTITGATGYQIGDGSDADRWGDITGTAVGTISSNTNATANPTGWFSAANNVVLTAKTSNFTGGVVQVVVYYLTTGAQ